MPQPIRKIHLEIKPEDLSKQSELATHIAIISSRWTVIENRLAHIFALAMQEMSGVTHAVLAEVTNVRTRLEMIMRALE